MLQVTWVRLAHFVYAYPWLALGWGASSDGGLPLEVLLRDIRRASSRRCPKEPDSTESKAALTWETRESSWRRHRLNTWSHSQQFLHYLTKAGKVTETSPTRPLWCSSEGSSHPSTRPTLAPCLKCTMVRGSPGMGLRNLLAHCPGDSQVPQSLRATALGGASGAIFARQQHRYL